MAHSGVVVSLYPPAAHTNPKNTPAHKAVSFKNAYTSLAVLFLSFSLGLSASAQAVLPLGITQWSTQIAAGPILIDMATGAMVLQIPVRNKAGALPFTFNLLNNAGNLGAVNNYQTFLGVMGSGSLDGFGHPNIADCGPQGDESQIFGTGKPGEYWILDSTGAKHPFWFKTAIIVGPGVGCSGGWGPYTAVAEDGSGYTAVVTGTKTPNPPGHLSWVVYNKDGESISSSSNGITDPDGNTINSSGGWFIDTLQEQVLSETLGGGNGNPDKYFYTDYTGTTDQYVTVNYSYKHVKTVFTCTTPDGDVDTYLYLPSSIATPTGAQYTFTYETTPGYGGDVTGRLAKLTLPSGGYIGFAYGGSGTNVVNGYDCVSGVIPQLQVTLNDNNGNTSTTTYVNSNLTHVYEYGPVNFTVTETDALGDVTTHYFYGEQEEERIISDVKQGVLSTTITCYNGNFSNCPTEIIQPNGSGIIQITQTDVFTQLGSGSWSLAEKTFDDYANTTSVSQWDWGLTSPGSAPTVAATTKTTTTYNELNGESCGTLANAYQYDRPCSVTTVNSAGTTVAQTNYTQTLGHPTQTSKWISGSTWANSYATYNSNGTIATATDANDNKTTYNYDGSCNSLFSTSTTFPPVNSVTLITSQTWDCNGGVKKTSTDANGKVTTFTYADPLWRETQVSYPDGGGTTTTYNTGASFPWSVSTSTAITSSTNLNKTTVYDGLARVTQTQLTSDPSGTDYIDTTYDLLGRKATASNPHRSGSSTTDGITTYTYDAMDRVMSAAEPDTSTVSTAYSANCTTVTDEAGNARESCVDGLGRLTKVLEDPGSSPHLNYETDYTYDALSNLLSATQKGSNQANARNRTFTYDGLSRLVCSANPEVQAVTCPASDTGSFPAGAITYVYDNNSNLTGKTAPLPNQGTISSTVTTTYVYDALNRLTSKSYKDGSVQDPYTPTAQFGYDGVALSNCTISPPSDPDSNPKAVRTSMCDGSGGTAWTHDVMGRVLQERRKIGANENKYDNDAYNLDGSIGSFTSLGYTVTYTYNGAAQPLSATQNSIKFVTGATYAPPGELAAATLGSATGFSGFAVTNYYNDRLQPILLSATNSQTEATVFSDCFDFHLGVAINSAPCSFSAYKPAADNGNAYQVVNKRTSTRSQSFTYDSLNRVGSGQSSGTQWGETFNIDAWGNMTSESPITGKTNHETLSTSANGSNQLAGFGYDAAGNMTTNGSVTYVYDAENRLIATTEGYSYIYDGNGNRVEKCTEGTTPGTCASGATGTLYWRGSSGDVLTETDLAGNTLNNYIFFNGQRVARSDSAGAVHYYFSDQLGSHALVENATGTLCEQDIDYYPYGGVEEDYCSGSGVTQNYKFTGKERDSESGLDNFGARYNASTMGRFMTPDWAARPTTVPYANFGDPQTLNLYSYARNNPTSFYDRDGHCWSWAQALCNFGQRINNGIHGFGFNTNERVQTLFTQGRDNLRQHGFSTEGLSRAAIVGAARTGRSFQTYIMRHPNLEPYAGRTSGFGTPEENVAARTSEGAHHMREKGYGPGELDKSSDNPDAIRGREQQLIEENGGAQSQGGTSGNAINGVGDKNPNKPGYMKAATEEFGEAGEAAEAAEGAEGAEEAVEVIEILNAIPE